MQERLDRAIKVAHDKPLNYRERVVSDPDCPGLRFVADRQCGGSWVRRHKTRLGQMRQYKFGDYPEMKLSEARQYIERMRGNDKPEIVPGRVTIGQLCERYLDEYIKSARVESAQRNARSVLSRYLEPIWHARIETVKAHHLHTIITGIKQHAPTMALQLRAELKQAWNYGLAAGWFDVPCPVSTMTGGRIGRQQRDRVLVDGEVRQLFGELDKYSTTLQQVIVLVLYTGMRSGEVVRFSCVDFEVIKGVLWGTLQAGDSKNKQAHRVPFFGMAELIIKKQLILGGTYLFQKKKGGQITQAELAREVYRKSGARPWRLHDLRRTTRTNLQRIGCPYEASEAILGHKLPGVSGVYARHRFDNEKIDWLKKLAEFYEGIQNAQIRA